MVRDWEGNEANYRGECAWREREREGEREKGRKCIAKYYARSGSDIYLSGRLAWPRFQPVIVISFARLMYTRSVCPFRRSNQTLEQRDSNPRRVTPRVAARSLARETFREMYFPQLAFPNGEFVYCLHCRSHFLATFASTRYSSRVSLYAM